MEKFDLKNETLEEIEDDSLKENFLSATGAIMKWEARRLKRVASNYKRELSLLAAFLVVLGIGYGIYVKYFTFTDAERAQRELAGAVEGVSKLILLPEGEEPVLATVTDAETLKAQQAFFIGAEDGDQLLLFPRSLKAILWSPSRNIIVNAGPIEQQQPQVTDRQLTTDNLQPISDNEQAATTTEDSSIGGEE